MQGDSRPPTDDVLDLPTGEPTRIVNPQNGVQAQSSGGIEILSNTGGVDFGAYLRKLKLTVQNNWEPLVPATALPPMMKSGKVTIGNDGRFDKLADAIRASTIPQSLLDSAILKLPRAAILACTATDRPCRFTLLSVGEPVRSFSVLPRTEP